MVKKVIVITGASGGIGASLAKKLGAQGHQLVLAARRKDELRNVASAIGNNAVPVVCDVTVRKQVEELKEQALRVFNHVDVWINNAGRGINRAALELTDDEFDQIMSVNLKSALYGAQAIIPHFKERNEGHLINISSFLGRVPLVSFRSVYSAAKSALNTLTANIRVDLAASHPGIHVSLVMPGVVLTDFAKNALGEPPQQFSGGGAANPQSADEVAAVIVSLVEHPQPEIYTNPALAELCRRYYEDVGAFEQDVLQKG
jgi:NADP-dependent 3-hydroxy acid dehydrogenase YdfG